MSQKMESKAKPATNPYVDPRVERTKETLHSALMSLIEERGFDDISVQDITQRARLNRATFYLHYRDKQDLLIRTNEKIFDALVTEAGPIDTDNMDFGKPPQHLVLTFRHLAEYKDFYRTMLGKSGVPAFAARMREYLSAVTKERLSKLRSLFPKAVQILDDEFIANFVAGALMSTIIWWLENKLPHSPEYMADRFGWLSVAGTYRMLGIEPPSLDN